jgi:Flp pilus assembly pilin Flp
MFAYCLALLHQLKTDKKGVTALEYGVIGAAAVVVLLVAFQTFYSSLSGVFAGIAAAI